MMTNFDVEELILRLPTVNDAKDLTSHGRPALIAMNSAGQMIIQIEGEDLMTLPNPDLYIEMEVGRAYL